MTKTNKSIKNTAKSNCKSQETEADNQCNEVSAALVRDMTNENVKNSVLITSIVANLFVITAFFLAVSDAPSAHALGQLIYSL